MPYLGTMRRLDVHSYEYRIMTPTGKVVESQTCIGIAEAVRVLVEKTGIDWSYGIVYRMVRAFGLWVAPFQAPQPSPHPMLVVLERAPPADQPSRP